MSHPPSPNSTPRPSRAKLAAISFLAGLLYAALLVLAFPTFFIWPLAFLLPIPLIYAADIAANSSRRLAWPAFWAATGTLPAFLYLHAFMYDITTVGYPLHQLYMAVWPGLFVYLLARWIRTRSAALLVVVAPVLWVGIEFIRGDLFMDGYPWFLAAHPTIDLWANSPMGNPASVLGVYGVTFLVITPAIILYTLAHARINRTPRDRRTSLAALVMTLLCLVGASVGILTPDNNDPNRTIRLAALQTDLPQSNKDGGDRADNLRRYARWLRLTSDAAASKPDVIVWPETMYPGFALNPEATRVLGEVDFGWKLREPVPELGFGSLAPAVALEKLLRDTQRSIGIPLLVGGTAHDGLTFGPRDATHPGEIGGKRYNSVFLVNLGQVSTERYDKLHLTPFGEAIPIFWRFPALQQFLANLGATGMAFDLSHGSIPRVFTINSAVSGSVRVVTPICYEITFSPTCRQLIHQHGERAADLMINVSNDGWFGQSMSGRRTHLLVGQWRCAETATPMFRSVNTGISAAIDSRGRVLVQGIDNPTPGAAPSITTPPSPGPEGILNATLTLPKIGSRSTIYSMVGDVVGWSCTILAAAMLVLTVRREVKPELTDRL